MAELGTKATITEAHRSAIAAVRPDLSSAPLKLFADGWDSLAIEAAGRVFFKFPHHPDAADRLRREPRTLDLIRPVTPLALPKMRLHEKPLLMSEHEKVVGDPVDPERYGWLSERERVRLADDLAGFFAAVHAISPDRVRRCDCDAVRQWPAADILIATLRPAVPAPVADMADAVLRQHEAHGEDAMVFGQFDTHGWNMAYNNAAQRLHGLFDFAGAGVASLHRDLSYLMFVSPDLTRRVVARYTARTGRAVDVERVFDAHGALRVIELCDEVGGPAPPDRFVAALTRFAQDRPRF